MEADNTLQAALDLLDRGWRQRRQGGKTEDTLVDILEAITILRKIGAKQELIDALGRLGHLEMDRGRWDRAHTVYEEAIALSVTIGDELRRAHKTRHLGDVHRHAGRQDDASVCYEQALTIYRSHPAPPKGDLANAIRMVALVREDQHRVEEAIELWNEARTLYGELNIAAGVEEADSHIKSLME